MGKKCSNCGNPAPDGVSVFCNRCGARLPQEEFLTCRKCGKTFTDLKSRFCDRCGSPLAPATLAPSAAVPSATPQPVKGTICPTCGFKNPGENPFYCKKCGSYIPEKKPIPQHGTSGEIQRSGPGSAGFRIKPDNINELLQRPVHKPEEQQSIRLRKPEPAPTKTAHRSQEHPVRKEGTPVRGLRRPVLGAGAPRNPGNSHQKIPDKKPGRSNRRIVIAAAGVLLLILVIAFIGMVVPSLLNVGGTANATEPGIFKALSAGIVPDQTIVSTGATIISTMEQPVSPGPKTVSTRTTPVLNQATTAITDTPLTTAVT